MDDYKELIDKLRESEAHMGRFGIFARAVKRAEIKAVADAIEQLVKERDAAVAALKEDGDCDYCKHSLTGCENRLEFTTAVIGTCGGENWEWRGVQE